MSDSLRLVRDAIAGMSGLTGDGLADRLAYWINDSTLSLWLPISQVQSAMNMAAGMRDSSWFGRYDVPADEWDTPAHVDEPPYPDWFTKDWRKWEKYGLYVDPTSPIQLACHARGDSVMVFEFKLPKARLLDFLGIDTTQQAALPSIVAYLNDQVMTSVTDSGAAIRLRALPGLQWSHTRNTGGDTLTLTLGIDWAMLRDSVLTWASGGSGASTFLDLTDTPGSYTGKAGQVPIVNPGETALEFGPMAASGTVTNAIIQWDTTGVAVDSTCKVIRMEWTPPVELKHGAIPIDTTLGLGYYRYGIVRYRLYLAMPENSRRSITIPAWRIHVIYDSSNGCWPMGIHFDGVSWSQSTSVNMSTVVRSLGITPPASGQNSVGAQYGAGTSSSVIGWGTKGATTFPGTSMAYNGRYAWYWVSFWLTNASTTTTRIAGWVDIYITYGIDHGTNSSWGAKIESVYWRQQSE
jgi:hypothetical protein